MHEPQHAEQAEAEHGQPLHGQVHEGHGRLIPREETALGGEVCTGKRDVEQVEKFHGRCGRSCGPDVSSVDQLTAGCDHHETSGPLAVCSAFPPLGVSHYIY